MISLRAAGKDFLKHRRFESWRDNSFRVQDQDAGCVTDGRPKSLSAATLRSSNHQTQLRISNYKGNDVRAMSIGNIAANEPLTLTSPSLESVATAVETFCEEKPPSQELSTQLKRPVILNTSSKGTASCLKKKHDTLDDSAFQISNITANLDMIGSVSETNSRKNTVDGRSLDDVQKPLSTIVISQYALKSTEEYIDRGRQSNLVPTNDKHNHRPLLNQAWTPSSPGQEHATRAANGCHSWGSEMFSSHQQVHTTSIADTSATTALEEARTYATEHGFQATLEYTQDMYHYMLEMSQRAGNVATQQEIMKLALETGQNVLESRNRYLQAISEVSAAEHDLVEVCAQGLLRMLSAKRADRRSTIG